VQVTVEGTTREPRVKAERGCNQHRAEIAPTSDERVHIRALAVGIVIFNNPALIIKGKSKELRGDAQ